MRNAFSSSAVRSRRRAGLPSRNNASARLTRSSVSLASFASLSLPLAFFSSASVRRSRLSRSASISSVSMVSMSAIGSIRFSTWVTSVSSKQRTTCAMASTSRILARNWLPRPSPREPPRTRPAMSTKVSRVGTIFADLASLARTSRRASGTATSPTLGSMVLNGYFVACAAAVSVSALKSVDLPTFGRPTMPHLKPMKSLVPILQLRRLFRLFRAEPLRLHGEMHFILEARVMAFRQELGVVGDDAAQGLDPRLLVLREIAEHVGMHQLLYAGMADADAPAA